MFQLVGSAECDSAKLFGMRHVEDKFSTDLVVSVEINGMCSGFAVCGAIQQQKHQYQQALSLPYRHNDAALKLNVKCLP